MIKNYSSLNSNTTLGFNKKSQILAALGTDSKTTKTSWFFTIMVLLSLTVVQKATANHVTNLIITTSYTYHNFILKSSVAEGRGGGGGHGNADLVKRHPRDAGPQDINTNDYNNNDYILHTLFNPIL